MNTENRTELPLREAIAKRLHELQCDRAHCDDHCLEDYEYEAADEILAMVALEKASTISNDAEQPLCSQHERGAEAQSLLDEAEEAYDPPEPDVNAPIALRIEPRAAASLIARMANHIAGCDWHGNPFDDGEQGCYHGKIYDADIGEYVPCPTCRRSTEQANGDTQP